MRRTVTDWLEVPVEDEDLARKGRLHNIILLGSIAVLILIAVVFLGIAAMAKRPPFIPTLISPLFMLIVSLYCLWLNKRGKVTPSIWLFLVTDLIATTASVYLFDGFISNAMLLFLWPIILSGMLLRPKFAFAASLYASLVGLSALTLEATGLYTPLIRTPVEASSIVTLTFNIIDYNVLALLIFVSIRSLNRTLKQTRELRDDLQKQHAELEQHVTELEQAEELLRKAHDELEIRVQERTAELARANEALRDDIAERQRVEEALRASQEHYRNLFDNVPIGLYRTAPDGRILDANPALVDMLGYPNLESLLAVNAADLYVDPAERRQEQALLGRKGVVRGFKSRLRCSDGTIIWVWDRTRAVQVNGKTQYYEGSLEDITARTQAEEQLKAYSNHLEELVEERTKELRGAQEQLVRRETLAMLGQLAGGVGHELRNPLGVIANAAYFLRMTLEEPDPEVEEALGILEKEVGISEKIISSLLDFARVETPTRQEVDVNDVVREALSRTVAPENIEVVTRLDETLPAALADPDQLVQVFGNIILNAYQAMPEGGRLVVCTELEQGGKGRGGEGEKGSTAPGHPLTLSTPQSPHLRVSISDTGIGISPENLGKIFEPLFTTKAKGIGLGLALVKTLVEANGGSIEVTSEVGKGSTFTIRLPVSEQ